MIPQRIKLTYEAPTEVYTDVDVTEMQMHTFTDEWIDQEELIRLIEQGWVDPEYAIERVMDTQWANSIVMIRSDLQGRYETCVDGSVFWNDEDYEYMRELIKMELEL